MKRNVLLGAAVLLLIAAIGVGQTGSRDTLSSLLLTQEELRDEMSDQWVIQNISPLDQEPDGAISVQATFFNSQSEIELVDALLAFEGSEPSRAFLEAVLGADAVIETRDLLAEAEESPDLLPDQLGTESDELFLLSLEGERQQLFQRRGSLIMFMRTPAEGSGALSLEQVLMLADAQFGKVLEHCASAEDAPDFCTRS